MPDHEPSRVPARGATLLLVLLVAAGPGPSRGVAQQTPPEVPDVAAREAEFEAAFASAVAMGDTAHPMWTLQAWGTVLVTAIVVEQVRRMAEGREDLSPAEAQEVRERVLERWRRARPESGGPDLVPTFEIRDPVERREATLALLDRYPDDPLLVWQAMVLLRQAREIDRAVELAESFLVRNPEHPLGYDLLAQAAAGNGTRVAEVLERWSRAAPGDPKLVQSWLGSKLVQQEPEATERMLAEFFARRPGGAEDLSVCKQLAGSAGPFAEPAQACIARTAADPDAEPRVVATAVSALVEIAAAQGDWSALLAALDDLEPESRIRAMLRAGHRLETPARCQELVQLLGAVTDELAEQGSGEYGSIAMTLRPCFDLPAARQLAADLLRSAPSERLIEIVSRWVVKVNDRATGGLPPGALAVLEQRWEEEGDEEGLLRALYHAHSLGDSPEKQFDLLQRWWLTSPSSFRPEQALQLAWGLMVNGDAAAAIEVLEGVVEREPDFAVAERLWDLYDGTAGAERAERFADELIGAGDPWRSRVGHELAARSALQRQDLAAAERHYWSALEGDSPRREAAVELLIAVGLRDPEGLPAMAERICDETALAAAGSEAAACAAGLLTEVGDRRGAAALLARSGAELPSDLESLREVANAAQAAGESEVAERALRRIMELDPRDENSWTGLGTFLEKQGRVGELEALLAGARERFDPLPSFLYRSVGRALTAAGREREAIDVLLEARRTLPAGAGGDWSRSWIDYELRQAYRGLGARDLAAAGQGSAPIAAFGRRDVPPLTEAAPEELRRAADALQSGEGGRYDPEGAADLYARAAAAGDPRAAYRLALLRRFGSVAEGPRPADLHARSAAAVERLAAEGDGYAQYLVGTAALIGLGGSIDDRAARSWLEAAAEQGESWAWHNLAWMAESGRGREAPDRAAALEAYRRASELGNRQSMVEVARLTLVAYAPEETCDEGLAWLEEAARSGNARAAAELGSVLFYGRGECVASDPPAAVDWLMVGAETRQPGAAYDLAVALLRDKDAGASGGRALSLLEQEAGRRNALAAETLAFLYATGVGASRDSAEARRWAVAAAALGSEGVANMKRLRDSAVGSELLDWGIGRLEELTAQGDEAATAFLAHAGWVGLAGSFGTERAVALARRAGEAGEAMAMRLLSEAYERGEGVVADPAEALRWRRRCAEAGDSFCMRSYGNALIAGEELARDVGAGVAWLRRAAEEGSWWAMVDLGRLYDQGPQGLARDEREAAAWKRRLAELGDAESAGWLAYHGDR